jgi:glutamine synthetase
MPDLKASVVLAAQPGWAWMPADQYDQEGNPWPTCGRAFLRRMTRALDAKGLTLLAAFELEWFLGYPGTPDPRPAHTGPAYGAAIMQSEFAIDLMTALDAEHLPVETFHPEAAPGQYEVSVAPRAALEAADAAAVVRQTIRAVSERHGFASSFSPMPLTPSAEGNGEHLHMSLWSKGDRNLFAAGSGRFGLTEDGEAFLAGVLTELPALVAVTCPSPASYLRLQPNQWAGAFACWGPENREAALRFITGSPSSRLKSTNVEFKPIDPSSNPYLAIGAIIAAGLAGIERGDRLPAPTTANPGAMSEAERTALGIRRLPASMLESIDALGASSVLRAAMGEDLFDAFLATRRSEAESLGNLPVEEMVRAVRWKY